MWLLDFLTRNSFSKDDTGCGKVTGSYMGNVAVNTMCEQRDIPIIAPYGVAYNPPIGETSVVLPVTTNPVCVGVVAPYKDIQPGELMLYSEGGAKIVLKNDGSVVINGRVFDK